MLAKACGLGLGPASLWSQENKRPDRASRAWDSCWDVEAGVDLVQGWLEDESYLRAHSVCPTLLEEDPSSAILPTWGRHRWDQKWA